MSRRFGLMWVIPVSVMLSSVITTSCTSDPSAGRRPPTVTTSTVDAAGSVNSVDALLADTKLLAVATAESVTPVRSAPPAPTASLATMSIDDVVRGQAGAQIVVTDVGGQPGDIIAGEVPIAVGRTYLLCLGVDRRTGDFSVVDGISGLFSFDAATQVATRLDPKATWIPQSFSLTLVRSLLEVLARNGQGPEPTPTTSTAPVPTTTTPPVPGACPPGCHLPSDDDAITVLASSASLVALVTVHDVPGQSPTSPVIDTDRTLQANAYGVVYPPTQADLSRLLGESGDVADDSSYLVFVSFDRGGSCLSSLFSYSSTTQVATLIESSDGQDNRIDLPGRVVAVPQTVTLAEVEAAMYPTGGVVYPSDAVEWYCPGP